MSKFNFDMQAILQDLVNKEKAKWEDKCRKVQVTRLAVDSEIRERREQLAEEKRLRRLREDEEERKRYEMEDAEFDMQRQQEDEELMGKQQEAC